MVERQEKQKITNVEHQFHHHHIKPGKRLEYADEFQPVITSDPKLINRGHSLDKELLHHSEQYDKEGEFEKEEMEENIEKKKTYLLGIPSPYKISSSMKCVVVREINWEKPWKSVLYVNNYPTPTIHQLEPDEVLVKLHAASVNISDVNLDHVETTFPCICGKDGAGEIVYMGEVAKKELHNRLNIGDEVLGVTTHRKYGTYAQYAVFHYSNLAKMPRALTWEQAAALPLASLYVWKCFANVPNSVKNLVQRNRPLRVLVHGGSNGTGSIAILLAKYYYMADYVYATCKQKDMEYVAGLGADRVIDYESEDFEEVIRKDWQEKGNSGHFKGFVNVVIDTMGGYTLWEKSCGILDHDSYFCSIALPRELEEKHGLLELLKFEGTIILEKVRHWTANHPNFYWVQMENDGKTLEHMAEFFATDHLIQKLDLTFYELQDVKKALKKCFKHETVGKIILKIPLEGE